MKSYKHQAKTTLDAAPPPGYTSAPANRAKRVPPPPPCFFAGAVSGAGNSEQSKFKEGVHRRMYTREEREGAAKAAFGKGDFAKALDEFVRAAELCIVRPSQQVEEEEEESDEEAAPRVPPPPVVFSTGIHTLFGNIAAVLTQLGRFSEAVAAADHAVFLNPDWAKGYFRKGAALFALARSHEAVMAYDQGLKVEPDSEDLKEGRKLAAKNAPADEARAQREAAAAAAAEEAAAAAEAKAAKAAAAKAAAEEAAAAVEAAAEAAEEAEASEATEAAAETTEALAAEDEKGPAAEEEQPEDPGRALTEAEKYAVELEAFLEVAAPSRVKAAAKRKRAEDKRAEELLREGSELSKTMAFGAKKNPDGDRWEDYFCEQRVR